MPQGENVMEVLHVETVYGDKYYIVKSYYDNPNKTQIPLATKDGRKFTDTAGGHRALRNGDATTLHRENIAKILQG